MHSPKIFFNNFLLNSKKYKKNLKKTERVFKLFTEDLESYKIPLIESFTK